MNTNLFLFYFMLWGVDSRGLAVVRCGLSVIIILDLFVRSTDSISHYSSFGVVSQESIRNFASETLFSLYFLQSSIVFQKILFLLTALAAFSLFIGYYTRISCFFCWLLVMSLHNRNILILNSGDDLLRFLLFWGIFMSMGESFSVDCLSRKRGNKKYVDGFSWRLQLSWMYLESYILKNGDIWKQGFGSFNALSDIQFTTRFGQIMLEYTPLSILIYASHTVLIIELLLSVFIMFPNLMISSKGKIYWFSQCMQFIGFFLVTMLHVGFAACMEIGFFPYIPIITSFVLVPSVFWDWIFDRKQKESETVTTNCEAIFNFLVIVSNILGIKTFINQSNTSKTNKISIINDISKWMGLFLEDFNFPNCIRSLLISPILLKRILEFFCIYLPVITLISICFPHFLRLLLVAIVLCCIAFSSLEYLSIESTESLWYFPTKFWFEFIKFDKLNSKDNSDKYTTYLFLISLFFIICTSISVSQPYYPTAEKIWPVTKVIVPCLRLEQYWTMFAPDPPSHTGYYIIRSKIVNHQNITTERDLFINKCSQYPFGSSISNWILYGNEKDALDYIFEYLGMIDKTLSCPYSREKDIVIPSKEYKNQRWRKFSMNLRIDRFQSFSDNLLSFVCRQWNDYLDIDEFGYLEQVQLVFASYEIGKENEEPKFIRLSSIIC